MRLKGLHPVKSLVSIIILLALTIVVACGEAATSAPEFTNTPAAAPAAADTPPPQETAVPRATAAEAAPPPATGAKGERVVLGLIAPHRDYFRSWIVGLADANIQQDPIMEWLFEIVPETGEFGPWLAQSYEIAPDSMSWNLKLAEGAEWHNKLGQDFGQFTAADLVHSHNIWCNDEYPGQADAANSGYRIGMCQVENVSVVNDHEVVMECHVPCPDLLFYWSEATEMIMFSKEQWDQDGEESYESDIAGTGPYIFQERKLGESILYEKAPGDHWVHDVDWNELIMTWTGEEATRLAQFQAGETHLTEVNKDLTDRLVSTGSKLVRSRGPAQQVQVNLMGNYHGEEDAAREKYVGRTGKYNPDLPWNDVKVRQAMNKAIDRETIKEELYKGRVTDMYVHGFYEGLPGWDDTWPERFKEAYGYDPERARELLTEAGYPDGFEANAWLFPFPGAPELIPLMEAIQVYLEDVGVHITLVEADWAGTVVPTLRNYDATGFMFAIPPSKKVVEVQISAFNAGNALVHMYETDDLYEKWLTLVNTADLDERDVLLREIGNIKFESFEILPFFEVFIEVIVNPEFVDDWAFPGWDGGDIGHTWRITACKQATPCR